MRKQYSLRPRVLGYRKDGRPIWSIAGASPEDPSNDPQPTDPPKDPAPTPDPKPDPDPGKTFTQADVERIIAGRLSKYADYDDLKGKLEELQNANASEQEKAIRQAREEGRKEVIETANQRLKTAEARAVAAEMRFRNPSLAVRTVDLAGVEVADDGSVDTDAIKAALDDLAKSEPYLIDDDGSKPPASFGGGPRKTEPARATTLGEAITNKIAAGNRR